MARFGHGTASNARQGKSKEKLLLLCGKLEEDEYALDFAHPLSPLHSFALFLCTSTW